MSTVHDAALQELKALLSLSTDLERASINKSQNVVNQNETGEETSTSNDQNATGVISSFLNALKSRCLPKLQTIPNADTNRPDAVWQYVCSIIICLKQLLSSVSAVASPNFEPNSPNQALKPIFSVQHETLIQKCMQCALMLGALPCIERELANAICSDSSMSSIVINYLNDDDVGVSEAEKAERMNKLNNFVNVILQSQLCSLLVSKSLIFVTIVALYAENAKLSASDKLMVLRQSVFLPQLIGTVLHIQRVTPPTVLWLRSQCSQLLSQCLMSGSQCSDLPNVNGISAVLQGIFIYSDEPETRNDENDWLKLNSLAQLLQRSPRNANPHLYYQHVWPSLLMLLHKKRDKTLQQRSARVVEIMLSETNDNDNDADGDCRTLTEKERPPLHSACFTCGMKMLLGPLLQIQAVYNSSVLKSSSSSEPRLVPVSSHDVIITERRIARTIEALCTIIFANGSISTVNTSPFVTNIIKPICHTIFCLYYVSFTNIAVSHFRHDLQSILQFYLTNNDDEPPDEALDTWLESFLCCLKPPVSDDDDDDAGRRVSYMLFKDDNTLQVCLNSNSNDDDCDNELHVTTDVVATASVELFNSLQNRPELQQLFILKMLHKQEQPKRHSRNEATSLQEEEDAVVEHLPLQICIARILELISDKIGDVFLSNNETVSNSSLCSLLTAMLQLLESLVSGLSNGSKSQNANVLESNEDDEDESNEVHSERGLLLITILGSLLMHLHANDTADQKTSSVTDDNMPIVLLRKIVTQLEQLETAVTVGGARSELGARCMALRVAVCVQYDFPLSSKCDHESQRQQPDDKFSGKKRASSEIDKAWQLMCDPLMPARAGGYVRVRQLIEARDSAALAECDRLLERALNDLEIETESYAYLAIIECLAAMAYSKHAERVVTVLCAQFAGFNQNDAGDDDERRLARIVSVSEVRILLAEALLKAVRYLGPVAVQNSTMQQRLLDAVLCSVRDPDRDVAASGTIILGEICKKLGYAVGSHVQEIFHLLSSRLKYFKNDDGMKDARRAAAQCLAGVLQCKGAATPRALGSQRMRDFYNLARQLAQDEFEDDLVVRRHCAAACAAVDGWMRESLVVDDINKRMPLQVGLAPGLPNPFLP